MPDSQTGQIVRIARKVKGCLSSSFFIYRPLISLLLSSQNRVLLLLLYGILALVMHLSLEFFFFFDNLREIFQCPPGRLEPGTSAFLRQDPRPTELPVRDLSLELNN